MDVRPGYKLSEAGVVPADWRVYLLDDCVRSDAPICYGILMPGPNCAGGVPVIKVRDIIDGRIDQSDLLLTSPIIDQAYRRSRLYAGDVLLTIRGTTGRVAVVPEQLGGANITQDTARARVKADISSQFIYFALQSELAQRQITLHTIGQAVKGINIRDVRRLSLPIPGTFSEQQDIATALGDVDTLLNGLDRLIAKKRDLKQAAMQQLLTGQIRLPGCHGEWETKQLNELADIRSGGTPSTSVSQFWDGNIPWCTPTDITALGGRKYLSNTSRMITPNGLKSSSAEMIPAYSIVMTSRATIGECAINPVPVSTNQGFKNFVPFEGTSVEFLYYLLMTQKSGFISLCGGSTFLEIGKTQLAAYQVRLPSTKAEQTAIAAVLSDMDAELAALEVRRNKTHDLKQTMMQELLTGRTRLI